MARPSVSALIYGYLKEKDLNLLQMTVEEWKEIEKDLVEIILAEVYPGEEISEDQLNFTTLAHSIAFMSNFIEQLNASAAQNADLSGIVSSSSETNVKEDAHSSTTTANKPKFEL